MYRQYLFMCCVAASAMLLPAGSVCAVDVPGDVAAGRMLTEKSCSECHSASAAERRKRSYRAPGFDEIAAKPQTTAISLRAFLQTPHPSMPNFILAPQERDDAIAYILSLKQRSY
jgi:mono/diheme cytochrome c family protein